MPNVALGALLLLAAFHLQVPASGFQVAPVVAQAPAAPQQPGVPMSRFVGTWVGTQAWAIADPPPGSRPDQPVTLVIEQVGDTLVGTMTPFMGGQDGATFTEVKIVGDELQAAAVVGKPRPAAAPGRRGGGGGPGNWKDPIKVSFVFKNDGVNLIGAADVTMGEVKWMKFRYDLSKKRSRY
jgi:hypothetical protein